jgi:outer membrane protein
MLCKSIGFLAVLGLVAIAGPARAQTLKLGYVDLQKALTSVEDGKAAKAKLEKAVKAKQVEFDKMQDDLKKLKDELEQQAAIMKDDLKRQKIQDYQRRLMELQEYYLGNQKELAEQEAKLTKPIFDRFEKILKKLGKDEGYTLIVEKAAAVYAAASIDVTDRLIREYNAGGGK